MGSERVRSAAMSRTPRAVEPRQSSTVAIAALGFVVLAFFGDLLLTPGDRVLSSASTDVASQFAGWRQFGFGQWKTGDFPLWNPLVYGGMPYFSGFQSALLYPPNWLFLVLPLTWAINWTIALNAAGLAVGGALWILRAGVHPVAAAFAGLVVVFGGPHFLHLYAGHLPNLCVMAWVPWLFLAIEAWRRDGQPRWVAAGAIVVAMETFAGHPQYVYYSAVAAALVALASATGPGASSRTTFALGVVAMFAGGALLAAVQLLPGLAALGESVRAGGTSEMFAGSYSLPPENLLTAVVPGLLGDWLHRDYWGRWFYWETCAFVGVAAALLVAWGAWQAEDRAGVRRDFLLLATLLVLALGAYTPLFHVVVRVVPGWDLFRGSSKFLFFAALFAARLAARGADVVLRAPREVRARRGWWAVGAAVAALWVGGLLLTTTADHGGPSWWSAWRSRLFESRQVTHLPRPQFFDPAFSALVALDAGCGLLVAATLSVLAVALLILSRRRRAAGWMLLVLGALELFSFAVGFRATFSLDELISPQAVAYRRTHAGDFRFLDRSRANAGLLTGLPDVWGDDPGVPRRYAEFVAATQGLPAEAAGQTLPIRGAHPRWDLLRFRAAVIPRGRSGVELQEMELHPLRRFEVVGQWEVLSGRDAVLKRVCDASFDPRRTVVLESAPRGVHSDSTATARTATILREGVDDVVVRVDAPRGGILLMTDSFSRGWHAESSDGTGQLDVMPANWAFRGIPLEPGTHDVRIFYRPPWLVAGAVTSGVAWLGLLVAIVLGARRRVVADA